VREGEAVGGLAFEGPALKTGLVVGLDVAVMNYWGKKIVAVYVLQWRFPRRGMFMGRAFRGKFDTWLEEI
jgi:hypothetical protein